MDFSAWFEAFLGGKWHTFDARHNMPRIGRILIARGRNAADISAHQLVRSAHPQVIPRVDRRDEFRSARVIGECSQALEMTDDSSGGESNRLSGKVLTLFDDRGNVGDGVRRQHVRHAGLQSVGLRRRQRRFGFRSEPVAAERSRNRWKGRGAAVGERPGRPDRAARPNAWRASS
jgi:hypothetical protein